MATVVTGDKVDANSIELNGSTSGAVTIQAPAVAGTTTLTLPSANGNILTDQSSLASAKLTGALPAIDGSALTGISSYTNADALSLFNASGSAPVYACRAWVNFNGAGSTTIRASGNISSVTYVGTGEYQVNFTTAMQDTNYSVCGSASGTSKSDERFFTAISYTTSSVVISSNGSGGSLNDATYVSVSIFR